MTDTATDHARAVVSAMTPGKWRVSLDPLSAKTCDISVGNLDTGDDLGWPCEYITPEDAAGIVLATALLRVSTDEATVEVVARAICDENAATGLGPECVMKYHADRGPCTPTNCCHARTARAVLDLVLDLARKEAM